MLFKVEGVHANGYRTHVVVDAETSQEAISLARQRDVYGEKATPHKPLLSFYRKQLNTDEIIQFCEGLGPMQEVDIPLPKAIEFMADQATSPVLRSALRTIRENMNSMGFAEAVAASKAFPEMVIGFLRAGQEKAALAEALEGILNYYSLRKTLAGEIGLLMIQPALILSFAVAFVILTVTRYAYATKDLLEGFNVPLPPLLQWELALGSFLKGHAIGLIILAGVVFLVVFHGRGLLKGMFEGVSRNLPVLGRVLRIGDQSIAAKILQMMFATDTAHKKALNYLALVFGNSKFGREFRAASDAYSQDADLTRVIEKHVSFDPEVKFAIGVGMKAGDKAIGIMGKLASAYSKKALRELEKLKMKVGIISLLVLAALIVVMMMADFSMKGQAIKGIMVNVAH